MVLNLVNFALLKINKFSIIKSKLAFWHLKLNVKNDFLQETSFRNCKYICFNVNNGKTFQNHDLLIPLI